MSACFHTPTAPPAAVPPPELQIEQAFIFCVNITPAGVSHGWKSQGRAGVGRGRQGREGWGGDRTGQGRAFSSRTRGEKEKTNFLCRQFSMSAPEEEKYPLFPSSILQTPISVHADTSLCLLQPSASPKTHPGCGPWCPVGCRMLWVLP